MAMPGFFGRHTKVNRALTEGRRALAIRLAGIEGGIECAKLAPQLSALADGEASAEDVALLRPHLKSCLSCRAQLKAFREAPARVAALVPPAALAAAGNGGGLRGPFDSALGALQQKLEAALGAAQNKAAVIGERAQAATELAAGQKLAAVAASAAALAGGGTAVDQLGSQDDAPPKPPEQVETKPVKEQLRPEPSPQAAPPVEEQPADEPQAAPSPEPQQSPAPEPEPDPANEFDPATAAAAPSPSAPEPSQPRGESFTAGGGGSSVGGAEGGADSGEFAP
jgi:hypothetical protein